MKPKATIPESAIEGILGALVVNPSKKQECRLRDNWLCYSVGHDKSTEPDAPIILIEHGPKNYTEIVNSIKGKSKCVVLWSERGRIIIKALDGIHHVELKNESDYDRIIKIFKECKIAELSGVLEGAAINESIKKIKSASNEFVNRGVFSSNYIKNRLFESAEKLINKNLERVHALVGKDTKSILEGLGWHIQSSEGTHKVNDTVSIIITKQTNLSIREGGGASGPKLYCRISAFRKPLGNLNKRKSLETLYK